MTGAVDDPKVLAVMNYQAAIARGDLAAARTVFQPDVVYRVPGSNSLAGEFHGPDQVMSYFGRLMTETSGTYSISTMHWMASADHVALATRNHATRAGRQLDWNEVIVFHFVNGKKAQIDLYSGDQPAVDAFFLRP